LREKLDSAFTKYVQAYFIDSTAGHTVYAKEDGNEWTIFIALTAKNLKLKSLYAGEWLAEWKLTPQEL